jgi:hypothetical protein
MNDQVVNSTWTVKQLREECGRRNIRCPSTLKKADLISLLNGQQPSQPIRLSNRLENQTRIIRGQPDMSWRKDELRNELTHRGIPFRVADNKAGLLSRLNQANPNYVPPAQNNNNNNNNNEIRPIPSIRSPIRPIPSIRSPVRPISPIRSPVRNNNDISQFRNSNGSFGMNPTTQWQNQLVSAFEEQNRRLGSRAVSFDQFEREYPRPTIVEDLRRFHDSGSARNVGFGVDRVRQLLNNNNRESQETFDRVEQNFNRTAETTDTTDSNNRPLIHSGESSNFRESGIGNVESAIDRVDELLNRARGIINSANNRPVRNDNTVSQEALHRDQELQDYIRNTSRPISPIRNEVVNNNRPIPTIRSPVRSPIRNENPTDRFRDTSGRLNFGMNGFNPSNSNNTEPTQQPVARERTNTGFMEMIINGELRLVNPGGAIIHPNGTVTLRGPESIATENSISSYSANRMVNRNNRVRRLPGTDREINLDDLLNQK